MRHILLITLLFLSVPVGADGVFKWVDEDGTVHFSDRKPTSGAERVEFDPLNVTDPVDVKTYHQGDSTTRARRQHSRGARVTMYSTSWCGYCKQAREYFSAKGIPFREYDIERDDRARSAYDRLGGGGVPLIKVGDRTMNGFTVARFQRLYQP